MSFVDTDINTDTNQRKRIKMASFDSVDTECATTIRLLAVDMIQKANSGHPGLPLGAADMAHVIFSRHLRFAPKNGTWLNRDRFVLSAGHGSSMLYALLHLCGYEKFTIEDLEKFRVAFSNTPGHPEYEPARGVEVTTGPLGQGFANGVGMALAESVLRAHFGEEIINHKIWVLASDGDLMEGVSHEAGSFAGNLGLDHLYVLYDDNGISIDGPLTCTMTDDPVKRFEALGWDVHRCENGNDMEAVEVCIQAASAVAGKPHLIACRTVIGLKSPAAGTAKAHGSPLGPEGVKATKVAYGRDPELSFYVPEEVRARYAALAEKHGAEERKWTEEVLPKYCAEHPEKGRVLRMLLEHKLPEGWDAELPKTPNDGSAPALATRNYSNKIIEAFYKTIPAPLVVGGSADLTPSNLTRATTAVDVARDCMAGNYVHYGIREHAMGSIMNALATYGIRPYGATFLVFSDYMRPAIRVAALMGLPVIFEYTHDSIGHGEDGPTHQPVEHLVSLRAIPNVVVIRPADGNEAAGAWRYALERTAGPTVLVFSKQGVPTVTPADNGAGVFKGGYVIADAEGDAAAAADVLLLATGSEVALALAARKTLLEEHGVRARVVSLPSFEIFDAQPKEYRDSVLTPGVPRVGIEAGNTTYTWGHYACEEAVGLNVFGASGNCKVLFEHFGITPKAAVEAALRAMKKL